MLPPIRFPQDFDEYWIEYQTQKLLGTLFSVMVVLLCTYGIYRLGHWVENQMPANVRLVAGIYIWVVLFFLQWHYLNPLMAHLPFSLEPRAYVPESYISLQQAKTFDEFDKYLSENREQIRAEAVLTGRLEYCSEHPEECYDRLFEKWRDEQLEALLDSYDV